MQYMLLIYSDEAAMQSRPQQEMSEMMGAYMAYTTAMRDSGAFVAGAPLQPSTTATTVRVSDSGRQVLDGPYAETREQLGGYYIIEVPDLDAALVLGGALPGRAHRRAGGAARLGHVNRPMDDAQRAVATAARQSYGKLLAFLAARTRDVTAAEDALAEAFASALAAWPAQGVPRAPDAWLLAVARRKAIDAARRRRTHDAASGTLLILGDAMQSASDDVAEIPDDRLRLMFACAHPAIDPAVRAPLILQTVLGFDAGTIASAFLVAPAAMGQRLVRAKQQIRDAGIPFRVPERDALADRLDTVLQAIYACYAAGWMDPGGVVQSRQGLTDEAIWLGRLVAALLPDEPEALGLLALMLHAQARHAGRRDAGGGYVPLAQQEPAAWDTALIDDAEALLLHASTLGRIGRFQLEAAVQSVHAARRRSGRTDWAAIVTLYDALLARTRSPVVAVNRAVALAETAGRRRRAGCARWRRGRSAPCGLPAVLGGPRRPAAPDRPCRGRGSGVATRDRNSKSDPVVRRFLQQLRAPPVR